MGLYPGSVRPLANATPIDVAINDGTGGQLTGFDSSRPATSVLSTVPSSITSVTLLAANPARRRMIIVNSGSKNLFVAFGATASLTAYSFEIPANSTYTGELNDYTGIVTGIWSAVNGNALVTEIST